MNLLPTSFEKNGLQRMLSFLNESNQIESIKEIDYYQQAEYRIPDKGHFGALVDSQKMGENHEPLTVRKIRDWQALLTREQTLVGHHIEEEAIGHIRGPELQKNVRIGPHVPPDYSEVPTHLACLIEKINDELKNQEKLQGDVEYSKFVGESFQKFESIHPFADGNGRTGRLIANYIATYCRRPIMVFNAEIKERNTYYDAHKSGEEMARFMANKIQETLFGLNGQILYKKEARGNTTEYQSENGDYKEFCEYHQLNEFAKK